MISTAEFQKGLIIKFEGQPWLISDFQFVSPGKGSAFTRTKLKNLMTGNVTEKTFKSGEQFEEADTEVIKAKFLYNHRDRFFFCETDNPSARFDLPKELVGTSANFMKANQNMEAVQFEGKFISIALPIKVFLKVTEAPPSYKGDTAQGGEKSVTLETGAQINAPVFVKEGDTLEINTETGQYVKRLE